MPASLRYQRGPSARRVADLRHRKHGHDGVMGVGGGEMRADLLYHGNPTVPQDGGQLHGVHPAPERFGREGVPEQVRVEPP